MTPLVLRYVKLLAVKPPQRERIELLREKIWLLCGPKLRLCDVKSIDLRERFCDLNARY